MAIRLRELTDDQAIAELAWVHHEVSGFEVDHEEPVCPEGCQAWVRPYVDAMRGWSLSLVKREHIPDEA